MTKLPSSPKEQWWIVVVGAEDVAQHLRKAGHRVLALEQLPELGIRSVDAAVLEIAGNVDARCARTFRSKLVEPVLIHRRRTEKALIFLSVPRRPEGELSLDLMDEVVANAVARTKLLRRLAALDAADVEAPTEQMAIQKFAAQKTTIVRAHRTQGGER
jgi:hypothetical protein